MLIVLSVGVYLIFPKYRQKFENNPTFEQTKSIAVLPFENRSNDIEQEYLSDGISNEIINTLGQIQGLKVAGRTSSFSFKNKSEDIRSIGKKLDVTMILEGSVQQQGDQVHITAQLIDSKNGFNIWSEKYTESTTDVFAVQDKIANSIAEKLEVTFLGNTHQSRLKRPPPNKDAYQLYLKGRYFWNQGSAVAIKKGIGFFQQAISLDSLYAEAYSGLADCYASLGYGSFMAPKEAIPKAKEYIRMA